MSADGLIGRTLGGLYRLDALLGEGGMGRVYSATQLTFGRRVAVKVLLDQFASEPRYRDRFLREARVVSDLSHPNVVRVIDFGEDPELGVIYLAMEHVDGTPLTEVIRRGPLPWEVAVRYTAGIALGLAEAHGKGVVHRDVKPDNVMIVSTVDGATRPVVLDFGIALPTADGSTRLTATGAICGTPDYMAPEQARSSNVDHRADLYSLGTILYEMLSGTLPFPGASSIQKLMAKLQHPAPSIDAVRPGLPPDLTRLVANLTERDPDERIPTALEVVEHCAHLVGSRDFAVRAGQQAPSSRHIPTEPDVPAPAALTPPPSIDTPPTVREKPPVPLWAAGVATVLLLGILAGGVLFLAQPPEPEAPERATTARASAPDPAEPREPAGTARAPVPSSAASVDAGHPARDLHAASFDATASQATDVANYPGCGAKPPGVGVVSLLFRVGDGTRPFAVYVPDDYDPDRRYKPLLLFHRMDWTHMDALRHYDFSEIADREGLIVISPKSEDLAWSARDIDTVVGMVEEVRKLYCLDEEHLFTVGIGSGERMARLLPDHLPVTATAGHGFRPPPGGDFELPKRRVPYMHIRGLNNKFHMDDGSASPCNGKTSMPIREHVEGMKAHFDCSGDRRPYQRHREGRCDTWTCPAQAPLVLCEVQAGRHWPDEPLDTVERLATTLCGYDPTTRYPFAEEIWKFFQKEGIDRVAAKKR